MIKTSMYVLGSASLLALGLSSAAFAQSSVTTDVGTLDRETAEKVQPRQPYSPPAGRNFPSRPFFGDTHLHTSFSMDAGAFGARLAPRDAYRFAKGEEVMASSGQPAKLVAAARLPRRRRSLRRHGLLPAPVRRQARDARRSDGPALVRHDPVAARAPTRRSRSSAASRKARSPRRFYLCPARRPTARPGRKRSRRRTRRTSPAASPPSSATSGPRTPAATTCTATSSSATTAREPAWSSRSRP